MAVENLGIYPNQQSKAIGSSLRILPTSGTVAPSVRFESQGGDWYSANVWAFVYKINKNGREDIDGYTYRGEAGFMNEVRDGSTKISNVSGGEGQYYVWQVPFSQVDGLMALLGTLKYDSRSYDAIRIRLRCRMYWDSDQTLAKSSEGEAICHIGFIPTFTASEIYYDKNGLTIAYTSSGTGTAAWKRPNDRWAVNSLKLKVGSATYALTGASDVYGTIGSAGKLTIPKSKLKRVPATGNTVQGTVRFAGSWMSVGTTLNTMALNTAVVNKYDVPAPSFTVTAQSGGVLATVAANASIDYVEVSMVDGPYAIDRAIITPGSSHLFAGVPYGVATEWQAVAYSDAAGELAASQPVTKTLTKVVAPAGGGATFTSVDGVNVRIPYDCTYNANSRPEAETVKLAGRQRPTVGFGEGGQVTWTVSGTILTEQFPGFTDEEVTDEEALRALPESGVQVLRFPDGARAQVYVTNCGISRAQGGTGWRSVSISAEEVS